MLWWYGAGSPTTKEGSRGENLALLSWVGSESSQAYTHHTLSWKRSS